MFNYILCDLDGTLLDDSERHYRCYCDIVARYGGECVTKERYWELKRNKIKRTVLLEETKFKGQYEQYANDWVRDIESDVYLKLERPKEKMVECLKMLKAQTKQLYLVTMRQNRKTLLRQLDNLEMTDYFDKICCVSPLKEKTKSEVVGNLYTNQEKNGETGILVIGDSEADEALARAKNAQFIGMTDGLRRSCYLNADVYCNNLDEVIEFLWHHQN